MIKPLRQSHYFIWKVLAIFLPALLISAVLFRPQNDPMIFMAKDISLEIRDRSEDPILVINLINPLKSSSCLVYAQSDSGEKLLGALSNRGKYEYDIPQGTVNIILRDILNKPILNKPLNQIESE
jgi:hypothetical protein